MPPYRLIWFQHLHKAAGTYIVRKAISNGEKPYPLNKNGNPYDENGVIPLWEFSGPQLTNFVDECEKLGITFVATEWGGPDYSWLSEDPRVCLITCLRNPIDRFISNFNYDYYWMWSKSKNYSEYLSQDEIFTSPEYYTRIFSRNHDHRNEVTDQDLLIAKKNLMLFDKVIIAKMGTIDVQDLGWTEEADTKHPTFGDKWAKMHLFRKMKFIRFFEYVFRIKHKPKQDLNIEEQNKFDIELYKFAKTLE